MGETIVVTRLVPGRNARVHVHDGRPALVEKLCWELHVRSGGHLRRVPCVCNSRNLELRWTCRYADALPAHEDGSTFPFCPPPDPQWADPGREAWRTRKARPTWADRLGHFWAEPAAQAATGTCHHWDVYLSKTEADEVGLDQLNIGRWRPNATRDGHPAPGALHHVPDDERGRLRKTTGWTC